MRVTSQDWRGADPKTIAQAVRRANSRRGSTLSVRLDGPVALPDVVPDEVVGTGSGPKWTAVSVTADDSPLGLVAATLRALGPLPSHLPLTPLADVLGGTARPAVDVARALARLLEWHTRAQPLLVTARGLDPASARVLALLGPALDRLPVVLLLDRPLEVDPSAPDDASPGEDSALAWARERAAAGLAAAADERWLAARCNLGSALMILRGSSTPPTVQFLSAYVQTTLARGEIPRAAEVRPDLRLALEQAPESSGLVHFALGRIAAAEGEYDDAWDHFTAAGAADPELDLPWRDEAAMAALRTGRLAAAQDLAAASLERAEQSGNDLALAHALRLAAVIQSDRIPMLQRALALVGDRPSRLRAQLQLDLAAQLLVSRQAARAVDLLREAETYADRNQLNPLLDRVDRLLPLAAVPARRRYAKGVASLSSQELRVAEQAAAGYDDASIATRLFLTESEVTSDLKRVMSKLHLRLRSRLGQHLPRLDSGF